MGLAASQCRLLLLTARLSDTEFRAQMISARRMALATQTEQIARDYSEALNNRALYHVFDLDANQNKTLTEVLSYRNLMDQSLFGGGQFRVVLPDGRIAVPSLDDIPNIVTGDKNEDGIQDYTYVTNDMIHDFVVDYVSSGGTTNPDLVSLVGPTWTDADYKNAYAAIKDEQAFKDYVIEYAKNHSLMLKSSPLNGKNSSAFAAYDTSGKEYVVLPGLNNAYYFQNCVRTGMLQIEKYDAYNTENDGWSNYDIVASPFVEDRLYTEDDAAARAEYEAKSAIIQSQDKFLEIELKQVETQHQAAQTEYDSVKKVIDKNIERSFKTFG